MGAIERIHGLEVFGSVLGLERMTELLNSLGNPEKELKCIHIAGTNGKGSTSRFIYEVLQANGYKVGLYTSPFIQVFNERIEFNHKLISDEDLEIYTNKVMEHVEKIVALGHDSPTEFEVVNAIAFLYFKEKKADYVVLEVGLGGRGDSTNVIKNPLISVITTISKDHMDRLGNTLEAIAGEKAGIIKSGCPVVSCVSHEGAKQVIINKSKEMDSNFYDVSKIEYNVEEETVLKTRFTTTLMGKTLENLQLTMLGEHQIKNAITAIAALLILLEEKKIQLKEESIYQGLNCAKNIGRFEVMGEKPWLILDGAHNEEGAKSLYKAVKKLFAGKKILMVVGVLADKDVSAIVETFSCITSDFIATKPDNPRALGEEELCKLFLDEGMKCMTCKSGADAVEFVKLCGSGFDVVLFAGSLYLIGEIRRLLENDKE